MPTALITGGARRLGRAFALHLASTGYDIALHYHHSHAEALQTAEEIKTLGVACQLFQADLGDVQAVSCLVPDITAAMGSLQILINSASTFTRDVLSDLQASTLQAQCQVNLFAPVLLMQAFGEQVTSPGLIVNLLDHKLRQLTPVFFSYTLSKAALEAATVMAAQALAPNVRVNAIAPGTTLPSTYESPEDFARKRQATPLQRGADIVDLLGALDYLLNTASVTGQTLVIDGGASLKPYRFEV